MTAPEEQQSEQTAPNSPNEGYWKPRIDTTGTAYIFEQRAQALRRRLQLLSFIGLVVPLVVGGLALAYGAGFWALPVFIGVGSGIGVAQSVFALWAIQAGWVDAHSYAIRSIAANTELARAYDELAKNPPVDAKERRYRLDVLRTKETAREEEDYKQGITDAEKRMGMRAALRKYQKACDSCHEVPTDMNPTECGVCGGFKLRPVWQQWFRRS